MSTVSRPAAYTVIFITAVLVRIVLLPARLLVGVTNLLLRVIGWIVPSFRIRMVLKPEEQKAERRMSRYHQISDEVC